MADILFKNFALLDVEKGALKSGHQMLVSGKRIAKLERGAIRAKGARTIDLGGRTLMPGLIDCHIHICMPPNGMVGSPVILPSLITARAKDRLHEMLMRGFTTVRDAAGADAGHKQAVEQGIFAGPRLFVSGRCISQTGGHGDTRTRADMAEPCKATELNGAIGRIADGVAEVRRAIRDEIRLGADQIKVMAGGGVGSAADPLEQLQYSMDEMRAAVDEAQRLGSYVLVHAYVDNAIRRAVEAGVRTIDHGNFLTPETAKTMARAKAYLVPTLVVYRIIAEFGPKMHQWTEELLAKGRQVLDAGTRSLEIAKKAGVKMAYGTDLGWMHPEFQSEEFNVRAEVLKPAEIIHSATVIGAEVVRMEGQIGVIKEGAFADLLVVDGDPLSDIRVLTGQGEKLAAILKEGAFVKNSLH